MSEHKPHYLDPALLVDCTANGGGYTVRVTAEEGDAALRRKVEELEAERRVLRNQRAALTVLVLVNAACWLLLALAGG